MKEKEPQFSEFEKLEEYAEALALYKDAKFATNLVKILKHFKEENPYSVQTEIAQENINKELDRLNPIGQEADENNLKHLPKKKDKQTNEDFDENVA